MWESKTIICCLLSATEQASSPSSWGGWGGMNPLKAWLGNTGSLSAQSSNIAKSSLMFKRNVGAGLEQETFLHHGWVFLTFDFKIKPKVTSEWGSVKRKEGRQFLKARLPPKAAPYRKFLKLWASTLNVRVTMSLTGGESRTVVRNDFYFLHRKMAFLTIPLTVTSPVLGLVMSLETYSEYMAYSFDTTQTDTTRYTSAQIWDYRM